MQQRGMQTSTADNIELVFTIYQSTKLLYHQDHGKDPWEAIYTLSKGM